MSPVQAPLPRTSLLKIPRQRRSRDMVHAILDAGVRILQEEGTEGFTTNRVADVAGVSVGSLYQYFANRDMIVAGIVERGVLDAEGQVRLAVATAGDADPLPLFEQLVSALLLSFEPYRDLLAEILSVTPVLSATGISALLETRLSDALRDFLVQHSDRYELRGALCRGQRDDLRLIEVAERAPAPREPKGAGRCVPRAARAPHRAPRA
jgi:AcrR family transcriptional regulator